MVSITALHDIGRLGPEQSDPVQVRCDPAVELPTVVPWVLAALLLLVRARREGGAWAILVPLIVLYPGWSIVQQMLSLDVESGLLLAQGVGNGAAALAALWLTMDRLTCRRRPLTFLLSGSFTAVVAMLAPAGEYLLDNSYQNLSALVANGIGSSIICASLLLAGLACGRRGLTRSFALRLAVSMSAVAIPGTLVAAGILMLAVDGSLRWFFEAVPDLLKTGLVVGLTAYLLTLPFVLLSMRSPFYRRSFLAYLGLEPAAQPGHSSP